MGYSEKQRDRTQPIKPERPLPLKIMFWIFVLWIALGWARFVGAVSGRDLLVTLVSPGLHLYLVLAGLIWGVAGLPVLWGIIRRKPWTSVIIGITAILYPALYWFERLVLWEDTEAGRNWAFMLLLTVLWLGLTFWVLRSNRVADYFMQDQKGGS